MGSSHRGYKRGKFSGSLSIKADQKLVKCWLGAIASSSHTHSRCRGDLQHCSPSSQAGTQRPFSISKKGLSALLT